jgi:cell pole-organizing protein PopZ
MEEILASIRRIIESNDPAADGAGLQSMPEAYDEDEIEEISFDPQEVANDAGAPMEPAKPSQPQNFAAPEPVAAPAERSLSLADVAARVRAASVRQQEAHRAAPRMEEPVARMPEPVATASVVSPFPSMRAEPESPASVAMPELRPALDEPAAKVEEVAVNEVAMEKVTPIEERFSPAAAEPEPESADIAAFAAPDLAGADLREETQDDTRLPVQASAPMDAQMGGIAGLLSEAAGEQVAKSFGELAAVFDGLERRSVEDMAQDMLRPMLQEWLDDNLPTLVERLVREEIERVARGPRR